MALREYRCECGEVAYLFDDEEVDSRGGHNCDGPFAHVWHKMPPRVVTVIATSSFMLDEPQLDSLHTIYELDRQLNIEARETKETELFQDIRRNL